MKILIALIATAALAGCVGYVPYGPGYAGGASYGNAPYSVYDGNGPYVVPPVPERRYGDGDRRWHGDRDSGRERDGDRRDFQRY